MITPGLPCIDVGYHDRSETSSSEVALFMLDPVEWYHCYVARDWPKKEPTEQMRFGTAVHDIAENTLSRVVAARGPEHFIKKIPENVLNADGHCKGKAWTEWKKANPSDFYIKPGEQNPFVQIWEHMLANSWCRSIIDNAEKEVEHFWSDDDLGCDCRVKFDASINNVLVDWKTTSKRDKRTFEQDIVARHYDVRLALYRRGFRDKYGCSPEIYIVAICTKGGFNVTPYRMPETWLDDAEAKLLLVVDDMRRFNIKRYLDSPPMMLEQPKYSVLDLESVE